MSSVTCAYIRTYLHVWWKFRKRVLHKFHSIYGYILQVLGSSRCPIYVALYISTCIPSQHGMYISTYIHTYTHYNILLYFTQEWLYIKPWWVLCHVWSCNEYMYVGWSMYVRRKWGLCSIYGSVLQGAVYIRSSEQPVMSLTHVIWYVGWNVYLRRKRATHGSAQQGVVCVHVHGATGSDLGTDLHRYVHVLAPCRTEPYTYVYCITLIS